MLPGCADKMFYFNNPDMYLNNILDTEVWTGYKYTVKKSVLLKTSCILVRLYEQNIGVGRLVFYGISTFVDYLIPNPVDTYISNIRFIKTFY